MLVDYKHIISQDCIARLVVLLRAATCREPPPVTLEVQYEFSIADPIEGISRAWGVAAVHAIEESSYSKASRFRLLHGAQSCCRSAPLPD